MQVDLRVIAVVAMLAALERVSGTCVSNCDREDDGHYQSCAGCNVYVSCSNGLLSNRPCPATLVWDDNQKMCLRTSETCPEEDDNQGGCISSCENTSNGDYQSCTGCDVYATCSNHILYDRRPCVTGLVWDDMAKRCEYTSSTCSDDIH